MQLQIRHIEPSKNGEIQFQVMRDGIASGKVTLPSPWDIMIGAQSLKQELRWYLEGYLKMPIGEYKIRAEKVLAELSFWGRQCNKALFNSGNDAQIWYHEARNEGLSKLCLKIISNEPSVLAWPWEALENEAEGYILSHQCHMERQPDNPTKRPMPADLPSDQLNILYIIARPGGDEDLEYQTLARPLLDYVRESRYPIHIDLLRPPTFSKLQAVLREKPNYYHIIHFDGHGRYDFRKQEGDLVFEAEDGKDPASGLVSADKMGKLLWEFNIPIMVLDACQSGMLDENADSPSASVGPRLLQGGVRSVVAMSYSIYVSADKIFLPEFYQSLFSSGNVSEGMRIARQKMFDQNKRDTFIGEVALQDWIVPVLYQQLAPGEKIIPNINALEVKKQVSELPPEAQHLGDYGFIGRDRYIQRLERALRLPPAGILIHGMAGEGKTTLAKGFLQWLEDTHGLGNGAFWFSFEDIHSAEYIFSTMAGALFGTEAMVLSTEQKLDALTQALKANPFIIVWDNFESASGIKDTEVSALLSEADRNLLKKFLHGLSGGKTKVIITSRSPEKWLTKLECYRLPLGGLQGEELWRYCNAVVAYLGLSIERDKTYKDLMDKLEGNPLAIRAILMRLDECSAEALLAELEGDFEGIDGDEATKRIQSALAVFGRGLSPAFAPILRLLGLHEHFANADFIGYMLKRTGADAPIANCFAALESAGLCSSIGNNIYQIHPALRGCLTRLHPAEDADKQAFVDVMGSLAYTYAEKQLHEQRTVFALFSANFHRALKLAGELDMREHVLALLWGLANCAQNTRNFTEAERLYVQLAEATKAYGNHKFEAGAYHQLGMVVQEQRDFVAAESWYNKSLEIELKQGNEHGAAITYHQLGMVAEKQRDYAAAEGWYNKSLEIDLKQGNEHGAASTYHQLGMVAEKRRDYAAAEGWHNKALEIWLKLGVEHHAARTYHQLGRVAEERRDYAAAESWYSKSLEINLKQGNEHGAALTYHQLGNVAYLQKEYAAVEGWYNKALEIMLKHGNEHGAALTYGQLGNFAKKQQDLTAAKDWFQKALEIFERLRDQHNADIAKHNLAFLNEIKEETNQ